ncbi:MAG: hypothetical protein AB7I35_07195 [Ramlibacter sp.]
MRDVWVVVWIFGWIAAAFLRLWPMKQRLLKEFGQDKDATFFIQQAKAGHELAGKLVRESWIFVGIWVIGALFMEITK